MGENVRKLSENQLVLASFNDGKLNEFKALLEPHGICALAAKNFSKKSPDETGKTFAENAIIKAQALASVARLPALGDDSGLEVAALGGQPGIYSARWAGENPDFREAMKKIRRRLEAIDATDYAARFVCVLCLAWPDGHVECFEGQVRGSLTFPPRGERGFGYDPIFTPHGFDETFGEMDPDRKNAMSHRADAFNKLRTSCLVSNAD